MKKKNATTRAAAIPAPRKKSRMFTKLNRIATYFTTKRGRIVVTIGFLLLGILLGAGGAIAILPQKQLPQLVQKESSNYWLILRRKSNREYLYYGVPGDRAQSTLVREFQVKTGIPGERPTPLPRLAGREYWFIIEKVDSSENPETAPYFLTLNVPGTEFEPFGPVPYLECNGQCFWDLPGEFGLHGVNGDQSRLGAENPGSSGCIRHTDEDITYLHNLLEPEKEPVRYYVEDI